jgi:16S rRNA C967 or C1407 C5-methylase (RsmB/RsmF family)
LQPVAFEDNSDIPLLQGKTSLRLLPHEHGTDGYFLASFRRV